MDSSLFLMGVSIFFAFFVQSVIGFAAPLIALPILIRVLGLQSAVGLLSIFLLLFSIIMTAKNWRDINRRVVLELSIGGVFGVFLGVYFLRFGNPMILTKALGLFILFYVVYQFFSKKKIKQFQRFGWVFGFIAGLFSGMFSSGGPFYVSYIYNKIDKANIVRGTIIGALGISNSLRFLLLISNGIIDNRIFNISLYMLPFFLVSLFLGQKLYKKINEDMFKKIIMVFLVISAISLLIA